MIGLSLSRCIADLVEGTVRLCDVEKIYTRTNILDEEEWWLVINRYKAKYWQRDPVRAEQTAQLLRKQQRIIQIAQVRRDGHRPNLEATGSHWVEFDEDIQWEPYLEDYSAKRLL